MRKLMAVAAVLAIAQAASAWAAKPGLWEYRSDVEIPGLDPQAAAAGPLAQMVGKHSFKSCVGADGVPAQPPGTGQCQPSDVKSNGDVVTWHVSCKTAQGSVAGDGKATYSGDSVKSEMDMKGDMGGIPLGMNISTTGSFKGACSK